VPAFLVQDGGAECGTVRPPDVSDGIGPRMTHTSVVQGPVAVHGIEAHPVGQLLVDPKRCIVGGDGEIMATVVFGRCRRLPALLPTALPISLRVTNWGEALRLARVDDLGSRAPPSTHRDLDDGDVAQRDDRVGKVGI